MCFGNLFIWNGVYYHEIADYKGFLIVKGLIENQTAYFFPAGSGDLNQVVFDLAGYCSNNGHSLKFKNITEKNKDFLDKNFPGIYSYSENRGAGDYIYLKEKLISLSGKKFHGKRNHIARFKDNSNWSYEPITNKNLDECFLMSMDWLSKYRGNGSNESFHNEKNAIRLAFENFFDLEFDGGLIRLDGTIVALTMGEQLSPDTYVIHIEKALPHIQGSYAIINQQFLYHLPPNIKYIKREDDMDDEGLRRSKLSYYPELILTMYNAQIGE